MMTTRARRGYTLIELIVSLGVFSIIVTLAAGGYFVVIAANRKAQATTTAVDNVSYALERMVRSIRTGTRYCNASSNCPNVSNSFSFQDTASGAMLTYDVSGGAIRETIQGRSAVPITDASVSTVNSITFYPVGTAAGSGEQSRVTVVILGQVQVGNQSPVPFTVETSATMRAINI